MIEDIHFTMPILLGRPTGN